MKPHNDGHRKIAGWRRDAKVRADRSREEARLARQPVLPMPGSPEGALCDLCFGRGCDKCEGQGIVEAKTVECPKCFGVGSLASTRFLVYCCPKCKGKGRVPA